MTENLFCNHWNKNMKVSVEVKTYLCVCMHILVYTKICENQEHTHNKWETASTYPRWLCWHTIQCTARKHRIFQINKTILSYILNRNLITGLIAQSWLNLGSQLLFNHCTIAALLMTWEATAMEFSMKSLPILREVRDFRYVKGSHSTTNVSSWGTKG